MLGLEELDSNNLVGYIGDLVFSDFTMCYRGEGEGGAPDKLAMIIQYPLLQYLTGNSNFVLNCTNKHGILICLSDLLKVFFCISGREEC